MNVYNIVFCMTHHCNSAPRVSEVAAGVDTRSLFSMQLFWVSVTGGFAMFSLVFNFER